MAYKRKRNRRLTAVFGTAIGLMLVFTFVVSLLNIDTTSTTSPDTIIDFPTITPVGIPTQVIVPTPESDPDLSGRQPYIHSSGYFQTFWPAGNDWYADEQASDGDAALVRVVIQSSTRLTLFHNFVIAGIEYDTLDSLSANFLTADYFAEAWNAYDRWTETGRTITEDRVTVDFELSAANTVYLGRAVHTLSQGRLYVTRIVTPVNNPVLLDRLTGWIAEDFQAFDQAQRLPLEWPTTVDQELGYLLKFPPTWSMVAGSVGRPVTLSAPGGTLRVWAEPEGMPESVEAVEAWARTMEPGAEVLSVEPFEQELSKGYWAAYSYRDVDGDPHSGLMVFVDATEGRFLFANLQIDSPNVNLIASDSLSAFERDARDAVTIGFFPVE